MVDSDEVDSGHPGPFLIRFTNHWVYSPFDSVLYRTAPDGTETNGFSDEIRFMVYINRWGKHAEWISRLAAYLKEEAGRRLGPQLSESSGSDQDPEKSEESEQEKDELSGELSELERDNAKVEETKNKVARAIIHHTMKRATDKDEDEDEDEDGEEDEDEEEDEEELGNAKHAASKKGTKRKQVSSGKDAEDDESGQCPSSAKFSDILPGTIVRNKLLKRK
jgi:hypothetical protein